MKGVSGYRCTHSPLRGGTVRIRMPCYLLHILEQPEARPYADPDLKDIVGGFPRCFCTQCTPPAALRPGEVVRCIECEGPCWKPAGTICP